MRDDKEFQNLNLDSFRRLPEDMRIQCVETVRSDFTQDEETKQVAIQITEMIKENPYTWWAPHHHGWGMGMRNRLRDCYADDRLPPTQYGDEAYSNWDDYVYGVVEVAFKEGIYHLLDESERV